MTTEYNKDNPFILNIEQSFSKDGLQVAYTITKIKDYLLEKNIIKQANETDDGKTYDLNDDIKIKLLPGIIKLIGNEYDNETNKIHFFLANSNNKFQIKKSNNQDNETKWFCKLYDNNVINAKFKIFYDPELKILYFNNVIEIHNKNQILYGPPGTGKTYNTIIKAMEIIGSDSVELKEDKIYSDEEYKILQKAFDEAKEKNQIKFVTFHQSYSYEEFVEGIKPELDEENISYKLEDGIFKEICNLAKLNLESNFDEIYEKFINDLSQYYDKKQEPLILETSGGRKFGITVNRNNNLKLYTGKELRPQGTLIKKKLENCSDWKYYAKSILEYLKQKYELKFVSAKDGKPYILIIDEINRGNISKIFGELITLIEEDKRGCTTTILPYSKESLIVPKNLYIIGTMNTSDRSIATIDIALRRRFIFKEMMPKTALVADFKCNFKQCFEIINKRISILLDRDHQIGHSYFIYNKHENDGIEELKTIWFNSILPLLNEYFYGDWEKLQALLGVAKSNNSSFIRIIDNVSFASDYSCDEDEKYDFNEECDFELAMKNAFGENFGS